MNRKSPLDPEFSALLRDKRLAYGISVADAARLVGVARSTWILWEGGHPPNLQILRVSALNVLDVEGQRRARDGFAKTGRPAGPAKPRS